MSRRRRQSLSPTLFPFLAVLVCTLGTLILLLALVARNTTQTAQQKAESPPAETLTGPDHLTVGQVRQLVEEEEFRLGELVSFREAQTADLEARRDQLAHVEDHMRRIRERLGEINTAMEQAMSDESPVATSEEELRRLREQLDQQEKVVEKLRDEVSTGKPRFVIVPHQGPNGTTRRPIYLECTAKGVTIWPEGVAINKWQLERSSSNANPLDDALRAARYHALQEYGDEIPPYPMLLVRPDGVETYYAARAAMLDWDDQFGYELVPSEIELAYPHPDPAMRQRMNYAVDQATQRLTQQSIARSILGAGNRPYGTRSPGPPGGPPGGARGGNGGGATGTAAGSGDASVARSAATAGSGYGTPTPPPSPKKLPRLSVAEMDRRGRQSGFRDHRSFPARAYGRPAARGGSSSITAEEAKRRLEQQLASSGNEFDVAGAESEMDRAAETAIGTIGQSASTASGQGTRQDGGQPYSSPPAGNQAAGNQAAGNQAAGNQAAGNQAAGNQAAGKQRDNDQPDASERRDQVTGSGVAGNAGADADTPTDALSGVASSSETMQAARGQSNSQTPNDAASSGPAGGPMSREHPLSQPEVSQRRRMTMPENDAAPPNSNANASEAPPTSRRARGSMVRRSGTDWALPSSVSLGRGNEIVRSIRVQVHADRFVIQPSASRPTTDTFSIDGAGVDRATLEMATAVRDRIERWGAAAPGARWSPRLLVEVMPGAETRALQLQRLMAGSGLPILRSDDRRAQRESTEEVR